MRWLAATLSVLLLAFTLTGCERPKSYSDYVVQEQLKCKEIGGTYRIFRDGSQIDGRNEMCLLDGTEVDLP